jgi:hypothetical protein
LGEALTTIVEHMLAYFLIDAVRCDGLSLSISTKAYAWALTEERGQPEDFTYKLTFKLFNIFTDPQVFRIEE